MLAIFSLVVFIFLLPMLFQNSGLVIASIITGCLALLIFLGIGIVKYFLYRREFKNTVVSEVIKLINPEYYYDADRHIETSYFINSKLFTKLPDRCFGDDFVSGKIEKTDFEFSELKAAMRNVSTEDGKKSESWEPVFEGLFFHADFNKKIEGTTYVLPDIAEKILGKMGQKLQVQNNYGQLVKLENPEFEKEFKVYSTGQQEARYILTPKMMEALVHIKRTIDRKIRFSFTGERVYCAIDFKQGLFEPRIFQSGIRFKDIEKMYYLFKLIETIIHEMNLNTRIWTKK